MDYRIHRGSNNQRFRQKFSLEAHGSLSEKDYTDFVKNYADFLASRFDNLIITPDNGVYTDIANEFANIKGKKPIAYYPKKETYYKIEHIKANFPDYEFRPIEGDWYKLNADLTKQSKIVISIGFSPGVLI